MKYKYSIIIPHYKNIKLLVRAIESIPEREDVQIIVVDNSPDELDFTSIKKKSKNKFELYFSDITKGAGHARNIGLDNVKSKWLLFLDADDFYNPGAFERFDKYYNSDFDIVYFSSTSVFSDTFTNANRHEDYSLLVSNYIDNINNAEEYLRYWFVTPWSKLIRTQLILDNEIKFDEVHVSNDLMFSVKSGHMANKIFADIFPAYCITVSKNSLTRTVTRTNSRSRYKVYIRQYKFMESINKPEMKFNLMSVILKSFRFGPFEFLWYLHFAHKQKVNIFYVMNTLINKVLKK